MNSSPRNRPRAARRGAAVGAAVALALGGLATTAAPVQAAAPPALSFTAAISAPDTAAITAAVPTAVAVRFTNTSNVKFPMGRVSAQLPAGIVISAPTVNLPGWAVSINGRSINAVVARPTTTAGVLPGGSITLGATALSSVVVTQPTSLPVPVKATGPFGLISLKQASATPELIVLPAGTAAFKSTPGTPLSGIAPPGTGGNPCVLDPTNPICSTADLTKGAFGNVYFGQRDCTNDESAPCPLGTEVELNGDFGTLYTPEAPAKVNLICLASKCPHAYPGSPTPESEPANKSYDYNLFDPYAGDEREVVEDYNWYPVYVQLKGAEAFGTNPAPPCVPENDLLTKGKITSELAIATGYCIDVNAITRSGNSFGGDLTRPVLFIEDPRMR